MLWTDTKGKGNIRKMKIINSKNAVKKKTHDFKIWHEADPRLRIKEKWNIRRQEASIH